MDPKSSEEHESRTQMFGKLNRILSLLLLLFWRGGGGVFGAWWHQSTREFSWLSKIESICWNQLTWLHLARNFFSDANNSPAYQGDRIGLKWQNLPRLRGFNFRMRRLTAPLPYTPRTAYMPYSLPRINGRIQFTKKQSLPWWFSWKQNIHGSKSLVGRVLNQDIYKKRGFLELSLTVTNQLQYKTNKQIHILSPLVSFPSTGYAGTVKTDPHVSSRISHVLRLTFPLFPAELL